MISNASHHLLNVNLLLTNGDQTNGQLAKLLQGNLHGNKSLQNSAFFQSHNLSATEILISQTGLEAFRKKTEAAPQQASQENTDEPEQKIADAKAGLASTHADPQKEIALYEKNKQAGSTKSKKQKRLAELGIQINLTSKPLINGELVMVNAEIKLQKGFLQRRPQFQAQLEKLRNTKLVVAKLLSQQEIKTAYKLAETLGKKISGADNFGHEFSHANITYAFTKDGEVLTNQLNIPTSATDKIRHIQALQRKISYGDPSPDLATWHDRLTAEMHIKNQARLAKNAALIAKRDALLAA